MVQRLFIAALAACLAVGAAVAAEAIRLDLKDFKVKADPEANGGYDEGESKIFLYSNGTASIDLKVPEDGEYTIRLDMGCNKAEKEFAQVKIAVGKVVVKEKFDLTAEDSKEYTFAAKLTKGEAKLEVSFLNDKFKANEYDMNFYLYKASVEKK